MAPSLGSYIAGAISLVLILAALGFGAWHLRRWIVPEFSGALARLAELVLAISMLTVTLQLIGTVGLLNEVWMTVSCVLVGVGAGLLGRARAPADAAARAIAPPSVHPLALLVAVGVASWSVAEWSFPSQLALDRGMFGGDTTWYHMPFAARFAQEESIAALHFTDPLRLAAWFYPQGFELLNGAAIALFDSDFLSPLMNLAWLAFGFLAAWCIGRPYAAGPATLVAAALVFDSGVMLETQAGEGRNDIMALALLVAFAAFIVNGHQIRASLDPDAEARRGTLIDSGPLILAGLAAGLAISVKLTMLAPVGAIVLGVIVFNDRARRLRTTAILGGALLVTGAYWYARNLVHSGNPLPLIKGAGPIELPHPDQMQLYPRPPNSVAEYVFEPSVYRHWFFPQLDNALGPLWAVILVAALAAAVYVALKARNRMLRMLAAAALVTALIYVFTPLTAAGPEGEPKGFFTNTRYLMPGLILALMLLPLARPLRRDPARRHRVLAGLILAFAVTVLTTPMWLPRYIGGTIVITFLLVWGPVGLALLRSERRFPAGALAAAAVALLALAAVLGRAQQVQYERTHYTEPELFLEEGGPVEAFRWVRDKSDLHIGVVGAGEVFFSQYGWYGQDLSNRVQYVGIPGPNGQYTLPETCRELRERVNELGPTHLVVTQYGTDNEDKYAFPVRAWLRDDPALEEILTERVSPQPVWVYRVRGDLDPGGCGSVGAAGDGGAGPS